MPKYSFIIPARNGGAYLQTCIRTILSQDGDFELIISDDNSTDGSPEFLRSLLHPRVHVHFPEPGMSMAEHWEWALAKASGEWLMFIGQDDGLQEYFIPLADRLTKIAEAKNMRAIMSRRAYYFWSGCEFMYGNVAVSYSARGFVSIKQSKLEALWALLSFQTYFELPEMYTTSLFHRSLIEEARSKQAGKLFLAHPQDANLGAIACGLENQYLQSHIPLGWVGSSPKSAGMAIGASFVSEKISDESGDIELVRKDYLKKTSESKIDYHWLVGDFSLASCTLYFWGALLQTPSLYSKRISTFLNSKLFKTVMLAGVYAEIRATSFVNAQHRHALFMDVVDRNKCSLKFITILSRFHPAAFEFWKVVKRISLLLSILRYKRVKFYIPGSRENWPDLVVNSSRVGELVRSMGLVEGIAPPSSRAI